MASVGLASAVSAPFVTTSPVKQREWLLSLCAQAPRLDVARLSELLSEPGIGNRAGSAKRPAAVEQLEQRWYESIAGGHPDYGVYEPVEYLAELWGCYLAYSRACLLQLARGKRTTRGHVILDDLTSTTHSIVDVGCGFGFSTAGLAQLFPQATVTGTNLPGTTQMLVAQLLATQLGTFTVAPAPERATPTDLILASEYFEHFQLPLIHLEELLATYQPRALLIANSFTSQAIGHFPTYTVENQQVTGAEASKAFNARLRHHGYTDIHTTFWNQRPMYWLKSKGHR